MIIVLAEVEIDPAVLAEVKAASQAMEAASQAEAGCLAYVFTQEVNQPTKVRLIEQWVDLAALQQHFQSAHMATFNRILAAHPPRSMTVKVYEVAREVPLPG